MPEKKYIAIGRILGPHGLGGWVKVKSYSGMADRFDNLANIWIENDSGLLGLWIEGISRTNKGPIIKFKNINSREDSESLEGCDILVDYQNRMQLPEDTFYIHDLIGIEVYSVQRDFIGKVDEVMVGAGNDVYVVKTPAGQEVLIPAVSPFVKSIETDKKRMVVELIEGMMPENEN